MPLYVLSKVKVSPESSYSSISPSRTSQVHRPTQNFSSSIRYNLDQPALFTTGCIGVNYVNEAGTDGSRSCQIITSGWFPEARSESSRPDYPFQGTARKGSCEDADSSSAMNSQYTGTCRGRRSSDPDFTLVPAFAFTVDNPALECCSI